MRPSVGCGQLLIASCLACCCGKIPTCGLWPELDPAEIEARLREEPLVLQHLCSPAAECAALEGAQVYGVWPIAWSPFTGEVTAIVEVEATCRHPAGSYWPTSPCDGLLGAVYVAAEGGRELHYLTEDRLVMEPSSGEPTGPGSSSGGGGFGGWD